MDRMVMMNVIIVIKFVDHYLIVIDCDQNLLFRQSREAWDWVPLKRSLPPPPWTSSSSPSSSSFTSSLSLCRQSLGWDHATSIQFELVRFEISQSLAWCLRRSAWIGYFCSNRILPFFLDFSWSFFVKDRQTHTHIPHHNIYVLSWPRSLSPLPSPAGKRAMAQ